MSVNFMHSHLVRLFHVCQIQVRIFSQPINNHPEHYSTLRALPQTR